jgi:hypothetical protein
MSKRVHIELLAKVSNPRAWTFSMQAKSTDYTSRPSHQLPRSYQDVALELLRGRLAPFRREHSNAESIVQMNGLRWSHDCSLAIRVHFLGYSLSFIDIAIRLIVVKLVFALQFVRSFVTCPAAESVSSLCFSPPSPSLIASLDSVKPRNSCWSHSSCGGHRR